MNSREAALLALLAWHKKGVFLWDFFEEWKRKEGPEKQTLDFAYELSCGTLRHLGYLEHVAMRVCQRRPKKPQERFILYLALYQRLFLKNIPLFAVVNESVDLAKKHASTHFASFVNAILRKELPDDPEAVILPLCYPEYYVKAVTNSYGKEKAYELLKRGNTPSPLMGTRLSTMTNEPCDKLEHDLYIQNITPFTLVTTLAKEIKTPHYILDMCASPGGKTLLLSKLFPHAKLTASDLSKKLAILQDNLDRFLCGAKVVASDTLKECLYDLVVVDAPCSNTGVLYKCPEARWRLSHTSTKELQKTQISLIERAKELLLPHGTIWYMTCSILPEENESIVLHAVDHLGLTKKMSILQLPNNQGYDGGYAAILTI